MGRLAFVFGDELDKGGHDDQLEITGADDHLERYARAVRLLRSAGYGTVAVVTDHGFFHWDAAKTVVSATPLFARAELMAGLKSLSGFRASTLLVTNLRPAFIPADARATPARQRAYAEALGFIRDLAAARTAPSAELELLFL